MHWFLPLFKDVFLHTKKVRFTDNKDRVFKSTIRSDKLGSDSFCLFLCDPNLIIEPQQYMFIQFSKL